MNTSALRAAALAVQPGKTTMHPLSDFIPWQDAEDVDVVLDRSPSGKLQVLINSDKPGIQPLEDMLQEKATTGGKTKLWLVASK